MREIKYPKMREARLKQWHGENWTEEDQEKFVRERNRKHCLRHRNKYREDYRSYQLEYQRRYREKNKYLYGHIQWNKNHPDEQMTLEQYVNYRQNKERMKEQNDD